MELTAINRLTQPLAASAPVAPVELPAEHREIIQAVRALNSAEMFGQQNELMFHMDRQAHRVVLQVVNRETKEVVTQVPPEYVLRLAEDLQLRENR